MLANGFDVNHELELGVDVLGDSKEILNPRGRPKFGELSGFHPNFCALAVLPSQPAFGSAIP